MTIDGIRSLAVAITLMALLVLTSSLFWANACFAHEVRPAYLELREGTPGDFDVLFKTPMQGDLRLALTVRFSGGVEAITPIVSRATGNAMVQNWRVRAAEGLAGHEIEVLGLANTVSDALLRAEFADGRSFVQRLTPASPLAIIPASQTSSGVAVTYLKLGIDHILRGFDHLLFVLGLILLAAGLRQLAAAITAFTAAHSITLAAAALGLVHVPPAPVEAAIALSIAFLAAEILRNRQSKAGLASRAPWLVAFAFGLLHGFGFAGALSEIGMPVGHIPEALLFFNVGVEVGQLLFVAAVLALWKVVRLVRVPLPRWATFAPPYLIGSLAMFWLIQRVSAF